MDYDIFEIRYTVRKIRECLMLAKINEYNDYYIDLALEYELYLEKLIKEGEYKND